MAANDYVIRRVNAAGTASADALLPLADLRSALGLGYYGGMYVYDASTGITITATDQYHPVVTLLTGLVAGWTYHAGLLGAIASVAEGTGGDGKVTVTDVAHGLSTGEIICITNSTDYNGNYVVTKLTDDTFEITATWTQTRTGTWGRPASLKCGAGAAGVYKIDYQLTVDSAGTNREYKFELVHHTVAEDKSACSRYIPGGSAWASVVGMCLTDIAVGDIIWLQCKPISNTDNLIIKHGNVTVTKL